MNYIISTSRNGHVNDVPLAGFTKLTSEPGTIYSLIDANTNKTPQGLKFHQEQNLLIVEHNGKRILALKGFFSHKGNPAKFVVDKAADGTVENIITADATVIYEEDGRAYIIASEPLLVANSELNTTNPVTPEDTTAEAEPDFLTDNWVWFAVGGAIILAGVAGGGSSSSSGKKDSSTDKPKPDDPDTGMPKLESIKATGNTITLTYNEALDGNNLPEVSAFAIQVIGGANNPVTTVAISDSGDAIILTLINPIAKGSNFTIAYTDPTTGDDANAIQDEQGNDASTFNGKTGLVVDGYIQGAQLYADYDNNGIAEDDEILEGVITDEFGRFFLTTDINAPLIAVGGTNTDTGIENTLTMRAPEGATVINPITTVVQQYLNDNEGTSLEQAETAVKEILGIALPVGERLSDYEPISSKNQEMQEIAAQIVEVAMQAETTKAGDGSTVFENIAATKTPLDLTTADDVTAITKGTGITAETVQALVAQTTNIKDTDTIADITAQQKSLIVALADDTGLEDDDLNSSVGTIEVTRKFTGNIQYSIDDGVIWTDDFDAEEGDNNLQVRQVDSEGKVLSAITTFAFILDSTAPAVVITDNAEGVATGDVTYKFTFSEAVTGFTADDITVSGGSKGLFAQIDDMTYQLVITPAFGSTTPIKVDVKADVVTDIAGNANTAAEQSVQQVDTPKVGVSGVTLSEDTGSSGVDFVTKTTTQAISAKLSESLATSDKLYGSVNDGEDWTEITDKATGIAISWDTSLIEGKNSIAFKVGEDGVSTGVQVYVLDTKVPTQMVESVAISDDTGIDGDLITKTTSQTITAKLSAVLETGKELLYGSVDGGTNWADITDKTTDTAISWTADLIEGKNSIVFQVRDLAGNAAVTSTPIDYTLDTIAPTQTVDSVAISDDTGTDGDLITKTASQTITAKLSESLVAGVMLHGSVDGGTTWIDITDKVTGTAISWDTSLIEGTDSIIFKMMDMADNSKKTGATNYVLDTQVPTQIVSSVGLRNDSGIDAFDLITNVASQTITAQLSASLAASELLHGSVDGGKTWTDITSKVTGTAISWEGVDLIDGEGSIVFKVTDLVDNFKETGATNYILDTKAPTQTVDSVAISDDTGTDGDFITKMASQTITAELSAELAVGKELLYGSVDGGSTWADITDQVTGTAISWITDLSEGKNSIVFQVRDLAGNGSAETGSQEYVLYTKAPIQTVDSVRISKDTGTDGDLITNVASQTITAKLSASLATGELLHGSVDGGNIWVDITAKATGIAISWDGISLSKGKNSIVFKITDLLGNFKKTGATDYMLDTEAPTVVITDNTEGTATGDVTYTLTFSKAVTGFTADDVTVSGGSKGLFAKMDDRTYQLVVTPAFDSSTPITVDVKANVAIDIAGNANTAAEQSVQQVDTSGVGVLGVTLSEDTGSSEVDFVTKTTAQTISAKLRQSLVTGEQLYGSVDGGTTWIDISEQTIGTAISWDTSLIEGKNSIAFKIGEDGANIGSVDYVLDTKAPTQTIGQVLLSQKVSRNEFDFFVTGVDIQDIKVYLSEPLATGDILYGSMDGGETWTDITDITNKVYDDSFDWKTILIEGKHSIVFKVTDLAGNENANIGSIDYVLDTVAPTQTVDSVALSDDTGIDGDFITKTASQTITAQLSSALATYDRLYGSVDGGATWADITDKATGTAIHWDGAILVVGGKNSISFKIKDWVNLYSAETGVKSYVLDTTAPAQTVGNVAISDDTGSSTSDFITKTASQTISAQLSEALVAGEILSGSVDGGVTWLDITDKVTDRAISWEDADLIEGKHSIVFKISNQYGYAGANAGTKDYVLDTKPPIYTVEHIGFGNDGDTGSSSSDFITKTASQIITAILSKYLETGDILYGSVNGGRTWTDITDIVAVRLINWDINLISGENSIVFKVRDLAGNETPHIGSTNYVLDTKAPTQTIDNVVFSADTGHSTSDFITTQASQTITAQLSAELATNDRLYGAIDAELHWIDITDKVTGTAISWDGITLRGGGGRSRLTFKVIDLAGHEATSGFIPYVIDTKAPTVTITDDTDGTATGAVTYTFVFSERVYGFTADSIEVTGGEKGTLKQSLIGQTIYYYRAYELTVTPPTGSTTPITAVVKADGKVTDIAGNKFGTTTVADIPTGKELATTVADVPTGKEIDRSIVIFDLTTGKSSTHSDRKFMAEVTDIYIIVYAETLNLKLDTVNKWSADDKLTASVKVHLISFDSDKSILGAGGKTITKSSKISNGFKYHSSVSLIPVFSLKSSGFLGRRAPPTSPSFSALKIWDGKVNLASGTHDGTIASGVLTSQGLI